MVWIVFGNGVRKSVGNPGARLVTQDFGLDGIFDVALKNAEIGRWNKPGEWNDPDYLQIGYVGSAFQTGLPEMTSLTPTEQYSFMSLWSLLAAPLIYSGDLSKLNDFTLNILCNPEVIDIKSGSIGQMRNSCYSFGEHIHHDKEYGRRQLGDWFMQ